MRSTRRRTVVVIALTALVQVGASVQPVTAAPTPTPTVEVAPEPGDGGAPGATTTGNADEPPPATTPEADPAGPAEPTTVAPAPTSAPPAATSSAPATTPTPTSASGTTSAPTTTAAVPAGEAATIPSRGGTKAFVRGDVVVYGGTPGGVAAAISAAETGARTVLITESATVGGLMSNGISASDIGSPVAVQGVAKRFFAEIRRYYRDPRTWRFEPRIAERVLLRMLRDAGVRVQHNAPVRSVTVDGRRIRCGSFGLVSACGGTFVDASYTGDLMAAAGAPHRLGMGDYYSYAAEELPAERVWAESLRVAPDAAPAARAAFDVNPFVRVADTLPPYREAYQDGTPSITYRLCVTRKAANRIAFRPAADHAALVPSFRLLAGRMTGEVLTRSNGTILTDAFHLAVLPGGKYDLNSGRLSYTNLPTPPGYFALDADRAALDRQIRGYVESFFHFVGTDPSVPAALRKAFAGFGLCADEFVGNGGWPREPYVREGRRLRGRATVTEADIFRNREKGDAVALASYNLDTKLSQFVFVGDTLWRDRGVHSSAPVYELPYRAMVPESGPVNLLVPVGVSASPTAFGSIRMEPQWMALGEAAGVAGALAAAKGRTVDTVPASSIQWVLRKRGTVHKAEDVCRLTPPVFRAVGGYTFFCDVLPRAPRHAPG